MRKVTIINAALAALLAATLPALAAEEAGKCGKGKRWDKETQTCVPKPPSTGSGTSIER